MQSNFTQKICFLLMLLALFLSGSNGMAQQVGINTSSPSSGALLDINASDGGFLIPRVELTGTNDTTTITPNATTGLLVYNTVFAGALPFQVTPGFYYWDSVQWRRIYNQGYTLRYQQTNEVDADSDPTVYVDLDGLDTGDFNIPFSGEYQLIVRGYLSAGDLTTGSPDGACIGSISLWMDTNNSGTFTKLDESFLTATSKTVNSTTDFYNMAHSTTIVYNVTLDVVNSYRFKVQGREWDRNGVDIGVFGRDTSGYIGASGIDDAQRGNMTFTLVRQQ
ncbi:MAG: hypothetical protein HKO97_00070 [Flavobacteriaceae bacterium]|nr:hypothetical protein [Flavobacteriaceae bacterium]